MSLIAVLVLVLYGEYRSVSARAGSEVAIKGRNSGGNNGGGNSGGNGNNGGGNAGNHGGGNGGDNGNNGGGNGGGNGNNGGGNGGGNGNANGDRGNGVSPKASGGGDQPGIRGRGLAGHAAVFHFILKQSGLHTAAGYAYTFHHENIRPSSFSTEKEQNTWLIQRHQALCSMYRYLKRLRELHPNLKAGYIDWITNQVATTFNEDPAEMKAALLGYPHNHPHTNALLRSVTDHGCGGTAEVSAEHNEDFAESHTIVDPTETSERFSIRRAFADDEIAFAVIDGDAVFTDYGISHEKEMHLLLVRNDLRHFFHVHPSRDADGTWRLPFTTPPAGTYWIFADFVDLLGHHHTVRFDHAYPGDSGPAGFDKNLVSQKAVGDYMVTFEATSYSEGTLFTFSISDRDGNTPVLQPYLGAMGHGILISTNGDFAHTHPSPAGDGLTFNVGTLHDDIYRVFTQFQVLNEIYTVEFDWQSQGNNHLR